MTILIGCQKAAKSFSDRFLFQNLDFKVMERSRIGLIGPNASGKSTLLKVLAGTEELDEGLCTRKKGCQISVVEQIASYDPEQTVAQIIAKEATKIGHPSLQIDHMVRSITNQNNLDAQAKIASLSGGMLKKLQIACSSIGMIDLLLLDEPTNHLDNETKNWLASYLQKAPFAWVLISHDRYFLNQTIKEVLEINKAFAMGWVLTQGNYDEHVTQKAALLTSQAEKRQSLSQKMKSENEWLSRNPKARGTKAKYRVDAALELQDQVQKLNRLHQTPKTDLAFEASGRKTKKLIEAIDLTFGIKDKTIAQGFNLILSKGAKLGVLGPNGIGKSTLLRVFAGSLAATKGQLRKAEDLKLVYFDQKRQELDESLTLKNYLCPDSDKVVVANQSYHIVSWAGRFGFNREQLDKRLGFFSGGEKAKAVIAKLMTEPADVLLLDEPTNDLDIETIENLEASLLDFTGAIVIVSHDRYLLENVCDQFLGFDGEQKINVYPSIDQWLLHKKEQEKSADKKVLPKGEKEPSAKPKKLSFKEKFELENIEAVILNLEEKLEALKEKTANLLAQPKELAQVCLEMEQTQSQIDSLYERWGYLESL